jgi:hypothetical protein
LRVVCRLFITPAAIVIVAALLTECGSVGDDGSGAEAEQTGVAKIGYLGPLLSSFDTEGVPSNAIEGVEKNANLALKLADRGYVLETGTIALEGTSDELLGSEHVRVAYLGL